MGSYYYENNIIKEEFLGSKAREEAEKIARKGGKKITKTKIRKFYNEVKNYLNRLKEEDFARIFPLIKMIKAKVSYELGRETGRDIPEEFFNFINKNIDKIKDKKDFEAFVLHFEAVLGYYYGLSNRK